MFRDTTDEKIKNDILKIQKKIYENAKNYPLKIIANKH